MGSVKIDLSTKEKRLEESFPLDTTKGVYALLTQLHRVRESRFLRGDYDASIMLIDFCQALADTNLTQRQRQVITYVFIFDLTQTEVAKNLSISQQAVSDHVNTAIQKVVLYNQQQKEAQDSV